ncbi:CAP-Gly domain containing protein, partial [Reticulomyxa filosa]
KKCIYVCIKKKKGKLEMIVGTSPSDMILQHRSNSNEVIATLQPDTAQLKDFGLSDLDNVHCVDTNPNKGVVGMLDSLNKDIDEKKHDERSDSFKKFKETHLKEHFAKKKKEQKQNYENLAKDLKVSNRCQLSKHSLKPNGTIRYIDTVPPLGKFTCVGVELDEPHGKYDCSVSGKTYFECQGKYGEFLRPDQIEVGDFPVVDEFANLSDEEL